MSDRDGNRLEYFVHSPTNVRAPSLIDMKLTNQLHEDRRPHYRGRNGHGGHTFPSALSRCPRLPVSDAGAGGCTETKRGLAKTDAAHGCRELFFLVAFGGGPGLSIRISLLCFVVPIEMGGFEVTSRRRLVVRNLRRVPSHILPGQHSPLRFFLHTDP